MQEKKNLEKSVKKMTEIIKAAVKVSEEIKKEKTPKEEK
jgi:hypothetical protein